MDKALVKGAKQTDIFAAIDEELARLRVALDRDPDPAEDRAVAVQEPSNDWPPGLSGMLGPPRHKAVASSFLQISGRSGRRFFNCLGDPIQLKRGTEKREEYGGDIEALSYRLSNRRKYFEFR